MNFFGVNAAAVNGAVIAAALASALAVGVGTASADATIIRPAEATYTVLVTTTATGVREARGAATVSPTVVVTAEWSIAQEAAAAIRITSVARASYSDATAIAASTSSADGTLIQGAQVSSVWASSATASADRTAGAEAIALSSFTTDISTSIKRSGQSTTEREGFVNAKVMTTATAVGDKTMLSYAVGGMSSTASGKATHQHGGQAVASIACVITALGASDTAYATTYSNATASPTHTQLVEDAPASTSSSVQVEMPSALRPGAAVAIVTVSTGVDARIAILATATGIGQSSSVAEGRLALRGQAFGLSESTALADAIATRYSEALAVASATGVVSGTRICMAESAYTVTFSPSVDAISNPSIPAPFARTMRVPAEDRAMRVPYENREMRVV